MRLLSQHELVVIARLDKIDSLGAYAINQPMLLGDSPGPGSGQFILQRFRLADAVEWIPQDVLDEVQNP
jgi:hypothetical protein